MEQSILKSVKGSLDIYFDDPTFDNTLLMHINTVFMTLHQIGVGPLDEPYFIEDEAATWADFIGQSRNVNGVRTYMFAKVKLMFDAPKNSFGIDNLEKIVSELEWRLKVNTTSYEEG